MPVGFGPRNGKVDVSLRAGTGRYRRAELHLSACGMLKGWVTGTYKSQAGLHTSMIGEIGEVSVVDDCACCDGLFGRSMVFEGRWFGALAIYGDARLGLIDESGLGGFFCLRGVP